jgi:Cu2+-exporting ATPase
VAPRSPAPRIVHETGQRIRFRWNRLLDPALRPDYLEAWLANLPGVSDARVNPQGRTLVAVYDGDPDHRAGLLLALDAVPDETFGSPSPAEPRRRPVDVLAHGAAALALPFLPLPVQAMAGTAMGLPHVARGIDTLVNRGLKVRVLDMATIGASLLRKDFSTAASISAMVVLGEYLKTMSDDKSNALLKRLIAPPVDTVRVRRDGRETDVAFEAVLAGDTVLCATGDRVPVEGDIAAGEALVDKSSITGESAPEFVSAGDPVSSGAVIVEGGLEIEARRTGKDTNMARIAEFMTRALSESSDAEIRSDRLADALAPVTLGLGTALYAATRDVERALSVLTVDFACAVKFPAPVVIKTSMHAASRHGVVVKTGRGLEALGEVDCVVFDKTGTLTLGELSVTDIVPAGAADEQEFLRIAAAVEGRLDHPIGRALVNETARRGLTPLAAEETDLALAHGVSGTVDGKRVLVGSRHFIGDDHGIDCSALSARADRLRARGKSLVYAARDGRLLGMAALRDTVRPEAARVIRSLRGHGVKRIVLLTGDHARTAEAFAARFPHVDEIRADLTPEQKAAEITALREAGYTVAMVGDGINDAPAFTAANVGVCMSRSTGLARDSAQIVLSEDSLDGLAAVHLMARRADRILQNCFRAGVGVNAALLLAAGAGMLRPAAAAAIHNANTFAILGAAAAASTRDVKTP